MQKSSKLNSFIQFYKKDIHFTNTKAKIRTLHLTGASCLSSFLIGTGKLIIAIFSMSFFTCVSALYTYAIVIAKGYVLYGIAHSQNNIAAQYDYYQRSGKLLVIAGTAYIIYSINLLFFPSTNYFDQNMAFGIAFFTFVELGLNIRGIIVERKNNMPLFHALKIINLASSCVCLVLTQTAILAYTSIETGVQNNSNANGIIGILMGTLSTLMGVYLYIHAEHIMNGKEMEEICKKVKKIMKKHKLLYSFTAIQMYLEEDGTQILQVEFHEEFDTVSKPN